jgi:hypothetical protein
LFEHMTTYKQENSDENTAEGEWFHLAQLMPDTVRYHGISHDTLQYCDIVTESDDEKYLGTPEQWKLMLGSFNSLSYGKRSLQACNSLVSLICDEGSQ